MTFTHRTVSFTFAAGGIADLQRVLMPDSRRIAIVFNPVQVAQWFYSPVVISAIEQSLYSGVINVPTLVYYKDVADIVKREWFAACSAAGGLLAVTEILKVS